MDLEQLRSVLVHTITQWPWLASGVIFTFAGLVVGAMRWHCILTAQRIILSFRQVFRTFFVGQFFNAFMLGACGGDVARAYYATRTEPSRKAEAASTVFVDRAIGLFSMIVFCCGLIILRFPLFLNNKGNRLPGALMFAFLVGSVISLFALFRRNRFEHWALFRKIETNTRLGPFIRRTYDAFYLYRHRPRVLLKALGYSALNMSLLNIACWSFAHSLGISVRLIDIFTLFPIISVIAAIPITPGSLGVREGLFVTMFQTIGVEPTYSLSLSLLVYAGGLVWSGFGGFLFLTYSAESGHKISEEIETVKNDGETLRERAIPED